MTLLITENLSKRYGGVVAVDQVGLRLEKGEILGLMGANGAGKTTLFSMLAGNVAPSSGRILLNGRQINGMPPERVSRLGIARTFQIVRPFSGMTVLENVMVGALYGASRFRSRRQAEPQCRRLLKEAGLGAKAEHPASTLNLAARKRLEIVRALATRPQILLLDEVLAGLNATEVGEALQLISEMHARYGLSIIIVEHVMKALMRLSHRIMVLHEGKQLMDGSPDDVSRDPRVIKAYLGERRYGAAA